MTDETTTTKKAGLSPIEVGAGAGAAVIVAFASSYLGTAGTLAGAAVASVIGTVSTSVLRNSAQTSAHRLKQTTTRLRDTQVDHARVTDVRPVESEDIDPYGTQLCAASDWIDPERRSGATGADPGSTWDTPAQQLSRLDPDGGSGATGGPGTGAAGPAPRPATGASVTGSTSGPHAGARWPADGPARRDGTGGSRRAGSGGDAVDAEGGAAGVGGPGTGATRPLNLRAGTAESTGPVGPGLRVRGRWLVVGASAVAAFALALGAITGIEVAAGKPLSGLAGRESGGGTTLGRATGGDSGSGRSTPSPTPTPTRSGGATSTAPAPRTGPTVSPTAPSSAPPSPAPSSTQQPPTQPPTQAPSASSQQTP